MSLDRGRAWGRGENPALANYTGGLHADAALLVGAQFKIRCAFGANAEVAVKSWTKFLCVVEIVVRVRFANVVSRVRFANVVSFAFAGAAKACVRREFLMVLWAQLYPKVSLSYRTAWSVAESRKRYWSRFTSWAGTGSTTWSRSQFRSWASSRSTTI